MSYRNCQAWSEAGMPLSTTNDEAAKLYDAAIKQFTTRKAHPEFGTLQEILEKTLTADPHLVMAHVLKTLFVIPDTGTSVTHPKCKEAMEEFHKNISPNRSSLTSYEKGHVTALEYVAAGKLHKAENEWAKLVEACHEDLLALKFSYGLNIYLGGSKGLRDVPGNALKHYHSTHWAYGYVLGMYAFGLEECGDYKKAEESAQDALSINRDDSWSTHSLAHVYEMTARYEDGLNFMTSTVQDWKPEATLMCHNMWHNALFHLEKMDTEGVLTLLDQEILPIIRKPTCVNFNVMDAASLMKRLEVAGVKVGRERWDEVKAAAEKQPINTFAFNDMHLMMAYCGAKDQKGQEKILDSLKFVEDNFSDTTLAEVSAKMLRPACEALMYDSRQDWGEVVSRLKDIHPTLYIDVGGSHAQRDVLNFILLNAASRSEKEEDKEFARKLLEERKAVKNTPLSEHLLLNFHEHLKTH